MMGGSVNAKAKSKQQQENEIFRQVMQEKEVVEIMEKKGLVPHRAAEVESSTSIPTRTSSLSTPNSGPSPICDRCHDLRYQSRGTSIVHPSMKSIQAIIEESPHTRNHIYHVLDAADFPMSLIPNLQHSLKLPRMRTQNRRSKHRNFIGGRTAEVSFIITRADLLAPKKEQVDTLMPYMTEVLRDALGRNDKKLRLGNVRCVSAKRGWWTKTVKGEIYDRGGAGWMVGKANVGKSALFEVVFPKGRNQEEDVNPERRRQCLERDASSGLSAMREKDLEEDEPPKIDSELFADSPGELSEVGGIESEFDPVNQDDLLQRSPDSSARSLYSSEATIQETDLERDLEDEEDFDDIEEEDTSLLPPVQPETAFPEMPLVSSLPGTTASPIRIPFGRGKGELIDLPGVDRSSLEAHVQDEFKKDMVMSQRIVPEQFTMRPTQSLLLGGLIRITPRMDEECVMLAYPFVPTAFTPHLTGTHKAVAAQTGVHGELSHKFTSLGDEYRGNIPSIATPAAKTKVKSAGVFSLKWDVTKRSTGSLTDKTAGKRRTDALPFVIYSADILIESVGWVEVVCQVRRKRQSPEAMQPQQQQGGDVPSDTNNYSPAAHKAMGVLESGSQAEFGQRSSGEFPEVEVFTPTGRFVASRRPMGAWLLGGKKPLPVHKRHARPRQTISQVKRRQGSLQSRDL